MTIRIPIARDRQIYLPSGRQVHTRSPSQDTVFWKWMLPKSNLVTRIMLTPLKPSRCGSPSRSWSEGLSSITCPDYRDPSKKVFQDQTLRIFETSGKEWKIAMIRSTLNMEPEKPRVKIPFQIRMLEKYGRDIFRCSCCKTGRMTVIFDTRDRAIRKPKPIRSSPAPSWDPKGPMKTVAWSRTFQSSKAPLTG